MTAQTNERAMSADARIFVAGHRGLVGSALIRRLQTAGYSSLLKATRSQLDLRDQAAVNYWFRANRPEYVFLAAGTVGGIIANSTRPAEFLYDNMMIHANIVHASYLHGVTKLLYLGSSCIYPRSQPTRRMPSPRYPGSSYARVIGDNTVAILFRLCRLIFMGSRTILI
jgi:GDP-L-fucose synthase